MLSAIIPPLKGRAIALGFRRTLGACAPSPRLRGEGGVRGTRNSHRVDRRDQNLLQHCSTRRALDSRRLPLTRPRCARSTSPRKRGRGDPRHGPAICDSPALKGESGARSAPGSLSQTSSSQDALKRTLGLPGSGMMISRRAPVDARCPCLKTTRRSDVKTTRPMERDHAR